MHVLDASKSVGITSKLIGKEQANFKADVAAEYDAVKKNYLSRKSDKQYISIEDARKNAAITDWKNTTIYHVNQLGVQVFDEIDLDTIRNYIDWTPFFFTWEMRKKYPAILVVSFVGYQKYTQRIQENGYYQMILSPSVELDAVLCGRRKRLASGILLDHIFLFWVKIFCSKIDIFVTNRNFGRKSNF